MFLKTTQASSNAPEKVTAVLIHVMAGMVPSVKCRWLTCSTNWLIRINEMLSIYITSSLLSLWRSQVGKKPARLNGTTDSTRICSNVSEKKVAIAGSRTKTIGVARQCNTQREESRILSLLKIVILFVVFGVAVIIG